MTLRLFLFLGIATNLLPPRCSAQKTMHEFDSSVHAWQQHYKEEFLTDPRSPLTAADTGSMRFFPPALSGRFGLVFQRTPDAAPIQMATRSGRIKTFRLFGYLVVSYPPQSQDKNEALPVFDDTLVVYSSVDRPQDTMLFLPFYDETNGVETYGGGRYMDVAPSSLLPPVWPAQVDFNKAYNPWCAYKEGYNCPIPPKENRLHVRMEAGEMMYAEASKE